jgi:predicted acyl esterase
MRHCVAFALVLFVACTQDVAGPLLGPPTSPARATSDNGPPPRHRFGRDFYQTGVFTGQGETQPGLTCAGASHGVRECTGYLVSAVDSTRLDVTVQIPVSAPTPVPLIALVHGYAGSKTSTGDVADSLLRQGYAVLRYSTRGFGNSWGRVNLVDVHAELGDLQSMIAQVLDWDQASASPPELDPDRVAVIGASYGGGHSWMAALQPRFRSPAGRNVHIRTVVPIAAWSDLLYALIPNGRERESIDRPGGAKLSFINALYLSGWRYPGKNPLRPYDNYPEYFKAWHAWINVQEPNNYDPVFRSVIDGLAGYRSIWWQQQFWRRAPSERLPVFVVQGFTDDLFPLPEAKRMVGALQRDPGYPVALYLGDIGHPRASNKPGEVGYVLGLIREWLAYYLKGVTTTPPPSGVYAALTRPRGEAFDTTNVINVPTLAALSTTTVDTQFTVPTELVNPATTPVEAPFWDPLVMTGAQMLPYFPDEPAMPSLPEGALGIYDVPVKKLSRRGDLTIAGQPTVSFRAVSTSSRVQVNVRLFDVDQGGRKQLITRGTYTIENKPFGVPIGAVDVTILTYGNYWRAASDHTLRLELTNVDAPYITPSRLPSLATLTNVRLELPIR